MDEPNLNDCRELSAATLIFNSISRQPLKVSRLIIQIVLPCPSFVVVTQTAAILSKYFPSSCTPCCIFPVIPKKFIFFYLSILIDISYIINSRRTWCSWGSICPVTERFFSWIQLFLSFLSSYFFLFQWLVVEMTCWPSGEPLTWYRSSNKCLLEIVKSIFWFEISRICCCPREFRLRLRLCVRRWRKIEIK